MKTYIFLILLAMISMANTCDDEDYWRPIMYPQIEIYDTTAKQHNPESVYTDGIAIDGRGVEIPVEIKRKLYNRLELPLSSYDEETLFVLSSPERIDSLKFTYQIEYTSIDIYYTDIELVFHNIDSLVKVEINKEKPVYRIQF